MTSATNPDIDDLEKYLVRKSTAPVFALVLSRGASLAGGSVFELLRQSELKGRANAEIATALYRSAHRDAIAAGTGGPYSVWIQRVENETALLERFSFPIELPVRTAEQEKGAMLTTAREQNQAQTALLLEYAREIARKNQTEVDRLTTAAAAADARAVEMAANYLGGVSTFANAALLNEERAAKLRAEKRSEVMMQNALGLLDFLGPTLATGLLKQIGVTGSDPSATPQWKDIQVLRGVEPEKFQRITAIIDPMVTSAIGAILQGDVLGEYVGPAIARAMGHINEEQAAAIIEVLGPPNVGDDGKIAGNPAQVAFTNLWRSRFFTISAQADRALKAMAEGQAGEAIKSLVTTPAK